MPRIEGAERVIPFNWKPAFAPAVQVITRSEPCWGLSERVMNGHRYQIIAVIRGDKVAECWLELPNEPAREFDIFCALEHSVAEVLDWAAAMRADQHWNNVLKEKAEQSTLIEDFRRQVENDAEIVRGKTVFGAGQTAPTLQRGGFHHKRPDKRVFQGIEVPESQSKPSAPQQSPPSS